MRFRDTVWDTAAFYEEGEIANSLKRLADAEGFEPTTSASGGNGTESRKQGYPAFFGAN
jgi:hypothetical protein